MAPRSCKIAVVIPKYGLVGGGEKFVRELTERIASNHRYDVHVFANKWESQSDRITFHKVPVISFPKFLTTISFAWFANRKIAKMNFDIIHTHDRILHADIFTMHGVPHRFWVKKVRRKGMSLFDYGTIWVEESLINHGKCRMFLPVSGIAKDKFVQEFGVDPGKIQVVHPGVDIDRFDKLDRKICRGEIRRRFEIDETDMVVLFVSMNFELKGLDNLIAAMAMIKSKHPSERMKLLVVGKGNSKKYCRLAEKSGIKNDVIFAGVWKDNIEQIYMASDIFAMPSGFDTFGMVVLEAMSASLPVIISDNVGAADLVKDGINGFVVEKEDIDSISSKIEFMLNEKNREDMAKEAHKTATNNTWDIMADKVLKIYDEMAGS
ncbi:MAG: glycosyltransferase family 4 protein [Deltaproteobacteria bacterium]|nr:glycosyltransferase family 4 protein [Deltaproteobacteria bacterium]